jgi:crossover junction endodeoxyribonuclease RuvC
VIILGVDPGLATTGVGVVETIGSKFKTHFHGIISTKPSTSFIKRLEQISIDLSTVIREFSPDVMSVEELFFSTNVKTAFSVGQARGVILLTAAQNNMEVYSYTPPQVKSSVCGYGAAQKKQVQSMVQRILKLDNIPKPDDAADALALAICHHHSHRLKSLV